MVFEAQLEAVGGCDIGPHQDGRALKDFIEGSDTDVGERLLVIEGASLGDGAAKNVMDRADRQGQVEEVTPKFDDATQGTAADQQQGERGLRQPLLGHGQEEEDLVVALGGGERVVQSGLGGGCLLIDELTTDVVLLGQVGDGGWSGEGLDANDQSFTSTEGFGGAGVGDGLVQRASDRNRMTHVCFLHEKPVGSLPPVWGKQIFQKSPSNVVRQVCLLPGIEPCPIFSCSTP
jgi:hypothetical protein